MAIVLDEVHLEYCDLCGSSEIDCAIAGGGNANPFGMLVWGGLRVCGGCLVRLQYEVEDPS